MNETYHFGLLLVVTGGFLATNSTGTLAGVGIWAVFGGFLIGVVGLLGARHE